MPRVKTVTKNARGTATCRVCGKAIEPGQKFYTWKKRYGGVSKMHTSHGFPKPSMLSNRKTAQIEDLTKDFPGTIGSIDDLQAELQSIADIARDVGAEYQDSHDNMPENLQMGGTGEALEEVAQELEAWADRLEEWEPEVEFEFDPEEDGEGELVTTEEEAHEAWLDEQIGLASDLVCEMPEYNG